MKAFKLLLGVLFGLGAISTLVDGLASQWQHIIELSERGLFEIVTLVAATATMMCFSLWSFKSALRRPVDPPDSATEG